MAGNVVWDAEGTVPNLETVEAKLKNNYYYAYARDLGQLDPVMVVSVHRGLATWCEALGISESSAKIPPLYSPVSEVIWRNLEELF